MATGRLIRRILPSSVPFSTAAAATTAAATATALCLTDGGSYKHIQSPQSRTVTENEMAAKNDPSWSSTSSWSNHHNTTNPNNPGFRLSSSRNSTTLRNNQPLQTLPKSPNHSNQAKNNNKKKQRDFNRPRILFLGTGSSTGCPMPRCALAYPESHYPISDDRNSTDTTASSSSCDCRSTDGHTTTNKNSIHVLPLDDPILQSHRKRMGHNCDVSQLASRGDPRFNKNYRNNPCILISHRNNDDDTTTTTNNNKETPTPPPPLQNVIIDVGKTFREASLRWMPSNHIRSLDAVVLTHEHMDAMGGLDDLRGFQIPSARFADGSHVRASTPVYLSQRCLEAVQRSFPWLVPKDPTRSNGGLEETSVGGTNGGDGGGSGGGGGTTKVRRAVAALTYDVVQPFVPFVAGGLRMVPLPVMHGEDLVCFGYAFTLRGTHGNVAEAEEGGEGDKSNDGNDRLTDLSLPSSSEQQPPGLNVVYLSDISRMLPETQTYILNNLPPTDLLIIDALLEHRRTPTHFCLTQTMELARIINAKRTLLVGMACDDFRPHDVMNEELKTIEGLGDLQLAYDGLVIDV